MKNITVSKEGERPAIFFKNGDCLVFSRLGMYGVDYRWIKFIATITQVRNGKRFVIGKKTQFIRANLTGISREITKSDDFPSKEFRRLKKIFKDYVDKDIMGYYLPGSMIIKILERINKC
jgi:hypothetical protein